MKLMFQSSSKQSLMTLFLKTLIRTPIRVKRFSKIIKMIIKIKFKRLMKTNINQVTSWNKINKPTAPSSSTRTTMGKQNSKKTKLLTKMMSLHSRTFQTKQLINSSILLTFNNNKMLIQRASTKK